MSPEYKGPKNEHKPSSASRVMAELIKEAQQRQRGIVIKTNKGVQSLLEKEPTSEEARDLLTRAWRGAGKDSEDRYLQIRK